MQERNYTPITPEMNATFGTFLAALNVKNIELATKIYNQHSYVKGILTSIVTGSGFYNITKETLRKTNAQNILNFFENQQTTTQKQITESMNVGFGNFIINLRDNHIAAAYELYVSQDYSYVRDILHDVAQYGENGQYKLSKNKLSQPAAINILQKLQAYENSIQYLGNKRKSPSNEGSDSEANTSMLQNIPISQPYKKTKATPAHENLDENPTLGKNELSSHSETEVESSSEPSSDRTEEEILILDDYDDGVSPIEPPITFTNAPLQEEKDQSLQQHNFQYPPFQGPISIIVHDVTEVFDKKFGLKPNVKLTMISLDQFLDDACTEEDKKKAKTKIIGGFSKWNKQGYIVFNMGFRDYLLVAGEGYKAYGLKYRKYEYITSPEIPISLEELGFEKINNKCVTFLNQHFLTTTELSKNKDVVPLEELALPLKFMDRRFNITPLINPKSFNTTEDKIPELSIIFATTLKEARGYSNVTATRTQIEGKLIHTSLVPPQLFEGCLGDKYVYAIVLREGNFGKSKYKGIDVKTPRETVPEELSADLSVAINNSISLSPKTLNNYVSRFINPKDKKDKISQTNVEPNTSVSINFPLQTPTSVESVSPSPASSISMVPSAFFTPPRSGNISEILNPPAQEKPYQTEIKK